VLAGVVFLTSMTLIVPAVYSKAVAGSVKQVSLPAVTALSAAQQERELSLTTLAHAGGGLPELLAQQQKTRRLFAQMEAALGPTLSMAPEPMKQQVAHLNTYVNQISAIQGQVDSGTITTGQLNNFYNGLLDTSTGLFDTQARIVPDVTATQKAITATWAFRASDLQSRDASLIADWLATGQIAPGDYTQFISQTGAYHAFLQTAGPYLEPAVQNEYRQLESSQAWKNVIADETQLQFHGPGNGRNLPAVNLAEWESDSNQVSAKLTQLTLDEANDVSTLTVSNANSQLWTASLESLGAILLVIGTWRFARWQANRLADQSLVARLTRLHDDAENLATVGLQDITDRLLRNERVDTEAEFPRLDYGVDEIGQLADAVNDANRATIEAVRVQAATRMGVTRVFQAIALQSQVLIHDAVAQLKDLEHDLGNQPSLLSKAFGISHLMVQLRRHSDDLVVLGGGEPGVRYRNPEPLTNVLYTAKAEVKDFRRVRIEIADEDISIVPAAIADTTHLLGALLDNATTFSRDDTIVEVSAVEVPNGIAVEIVDQGVGMKPDQLVQTAEMMQDPPEFDVMALQEDPRLGLFVVSRLAMRHGITVSFEKSRYGGVRVTSLLPNDMLVHAGSGPVTNGIEPLSSAREERRAPREESPVETNGTHSPSSAVTALLSPQSGAERLGILEDQEGSAGSGSETEAGAVTQPSGGEKTDSSLPPLPQRRRMTHRVEDLQDSLGQPDGTEESPDSLEDQAQRRINSLLQFHEGTSLGRQQPDEGV
jgi:signal transduction histidine kinase